MKLELRAYKNYYEEGYKPEIESEYCYSVDDNGPANHGWAHLTKEENNLWVKFIDAAGVAKIGIESLIRVLIKNNDFFFGEEEFIIYAINKIYNNLMEKSKEYYKDIEQDPKGWWHLNDDEFCHHSKEEAAFYAAYCDIEKICCD